MAEYWKSLPRKYCEACKCWFADNKSSIDFHERGKRHQENVAKRISEIRKKGQKEYEAKRKHDADMKKIEEAALKAFQKDLKNDPKLAERYGSWTPVDVDKIKPEPGLSNVSCSQSKSVPSVQLSKVKREKAESSPCCNKKEPKWFEGKSPEGYTYYYNSETGQSQWEAPYEGFVPLSQAEIKQEQPGSNFDGYGPQPRHDPYGAWAPVIEAKQESVDLQLPEKREIIEINIPLNPEESKIEFKEKTVSALDGCQSGGSVQFKRRKNLSDHRRNVRTRTDD